MEDVSHAYGYDTLNRLSTDARTAGTTTWTYDAADQIKSITDTAANTTSTLGYDIAHELTSFVKKTGTTTNQNLTMGYNANGDRTCQTDSVTTTTLHPHDERGGVARKAARGEFDEEGDAFIAAARLVAQWAGFGSGEPRTQDSGGACISAWR